MQSGSQSKLSRRNIIAAVTSISALGWTQLGTSAAEPTAIDACTVIDESGTYELASDIEGSGDDPCITITAEDVTLSGGGHSIIGNEATGIAIEEADTWIHNLTIRDCSTAIDAITPGIHIELTLEELTITENQTGIHCFENGDVRIFSSDITANDGNAIVAGQLLDGSVVIEDCTIRDNGGNALWHDEVWDMQISDTIIESNGAGLNMSFGTIDGCEIRDNDLFGIEVFPTPVAPADTPITITDSIISGNTGTGVAVRNGVVEITGCFIDDNESGVDIASGLPDDFVIEATLERNSITNNSTYGLESHLEEQTQARCNWWGDPSGPIHDDSPEENPAGEELSGEIEFTPWLVSDTLSTTDDCIGGTAAVFDITIRDGPSTAMPEEVVTIDFRVENTGGISATQDIVFEVDTEEIDSDTISLAAGEGVDSTFDYQIPADATQPVTLTVRSADDSASADIDIHEPDEDDTADDTTDPDEPEVDDDDIPAADPDDEEPDPDDDDTPDDTAPENDDADRADDEPSDIIPGFGIVSAIAGLGGMAYLIRRRNRQKPKN